MHDPIRDAVERAIQEGKTHPPPGKKTENRRVFRLCQFLLTATSPDAHDSENLEPYLLAWYNACKPFILDEQAVLTYDVIRAQFHGLWDRHKAMYAANDLWQTIQQQAQADTSPHTEFDRYSDPAVKRLALCLYHASRRTPEHTFFISCTDAGRILRRTHATAGLILAMFCADGLISRTQKGHTGRASEYRFLP